MNAVGLPWFAALCSILGSTGATGSNNPLGDARVVWHMGTLEGSEANPLSLKVNGRVDVGLRLDGEEYQESIRRGGDGHVAVLHEDGWLSLDTCRANSIQPVGDSLSLYVRAWVGPDGYGTFFFSDFVSLSVYPTGLLIASLGVETPQGKTYRSIPLCTVERGGWLDLVLRLSGGRLELFRNGVLDASIPIRQKMVSPFDDVMQIGAYAWAGPDLHVHPVSGFHSGRIDTVALWDRALDEGEIAFLSGLEKLPPARLGGAADGAIRDYNAFFDASLRKDTAACSRLWRSMCEFADEDPWRPVYHLAPPVGGILDPAGAYYYGGRYHVFSYRNIMDLLHYCSLDHYVSDDLVHWTEWPVGPWADSDLDVFGIWLMNHFIDDDGTPSVIYTGLGVRGKFGILARSHDGLISYVDKRPVLTRYDHDGHVWKDGDTWYTITTKMSKGVRSGTQGDGVMLWSSPDLQKWTERGEIFTQPKIPDSTSGGDVVGFTEFPYLLKFGDKDVLMMGSHPVRYWVGRFDREKVKFLPDGDHGTLLDYANPFHCFNPLCVDDKGPGGSPRRLVMALHGGVAGGRDGIPWYGAHAMPRVLSLDGDRLRQDPPAEIEILRGAHYSEAGISIAPGNGGYVKARGSAVEVVAEFVPGDARRLGLKLRVSDDGRSFARIYFDTTIGEFGVDGNVPDTHRDLNLKPGQGCPTRIGKGDRVQMRVFVDRRMVEAFVDGQTCTTSLQDLGAVGDGIDVFSEGGSARCERLDVWEMRPARAR